jgi:subtilisin
MGVAPKCQIVSCKVLNNDGVGEMSAVARALLFAVEVDCSIVVMSLGSPIGDERLTAALAVAHEAGVSVVCAAGNTGGAVTFPAAYHETIAVGAVDRMGRLCEFSARGREIDVAAPGYQIRSCWVGGGYATLSGTSMAAPFVGGVLALAAGNCNGKVKDAKKLLQDTASDAGAPGQDNEYGWGLVSPASVVDREVCEIL